jgi:hypothetical protein
VTLLAHNVFCHPDFRPNRPGVPQSSGKSLFTFYSFFHTDRIKASPAFHPMESGENRRASVNVAQRSTLMKIRVSRAGNRTGRILFHTTARSAEIHKPQ